jgi:uncharacterized peroxidase-related enzyme
MQRITALNPETTTGKSKDLFNAIQSKLGLVPNMMRTFGNSPAALNGYLSFNAALNEGVLGGKLGELIALTVANVNQCEYCNAAHSFIGEKLVHIDPNTLADARHGKSTDAKIQAALTFSKIIVQKRGLINDDDVNALKDAGYNEAEITEIIAHVGLNILTNYFNNVANVTVDFPKVELIETAVI